MLRSRFRISSHTLVLCVSPPAMGVDEKTNYADEKTESTVEHHDAPVSATEFEATPEERRLVRRLDMRIMPIACVMYLFACKFSFPLCLARKPLLNVTLVL